MVETSTNKPTPDASLAIDLRNPCAAGVLAWLFPGAGHYYQRRYFKACLFAICIWPILIAGLVMGTFTEETPNGPTASQVNFARTVYCSWRPGDKRLYFIPQACVGCVAVPAMWQAKFPKDADGSFASTAFAPPRMPSEYQTRPNQPDLNDIVAHLHSWLDISTLFTVVAGLLNLLAVFDAIGGPAPKDPEEEKNDSSDENNTNAETEK